MTQYVAGFLFRDVTYSTGTRRQVALVMKQRPKWQAGRLNGIGGKIEKGEEPLNAMVREFNEETGVLVEAKFWRRFCTLFHGEHTVHFFTARRYCELTQMTDEVVGWHSVESISHFPKENMIQNLKWLIPLALDEDRVHAAIHDCSTPWN